MVGLRRQLVRVPLAGGLDEASERHIAPAGKLLRLDNGHYVRTPASGAAVIEPRTGFQTLGVQTADGGTMSGIRTIASTGREIICLTDTALYARDAESGTWVDKGTVSPFAGKATSILRDEWDWRYADLVTDGSGKYGMIAASGFPYHASLTWDYVRFVCIGLPAGEVVVPTHTPYASVSMAMPKCGYVNGHWLTIAKATSGNDLHYFAWEGDITSQVSHRGALETDAIYDSSLRTYDITTGWQNTDERFAVAYIDYTRQQINVKTRDASFNLDKSTSIATSGENRYITLAIHYDTEADLLYVLYVLDDATTGVEQLNCTAYSPQLVSQWTVVLWTSSSTTETVKSLGVCHQSGNNRMLAAWSTYDSNTGETVTRTVAVARTTGGSASNVVTLHNSVLFSRPWQEDGEVYVAIHWRVKRAYEKTFRTAVIFRLDAFGTGEGGESTYDYVGDRYLLCGVYDVGTAEWVDESGISQEGQGAAQNVITDQSAGRCYASMSRSADYQDYAGNLYSRGGVDLVRLDYSHAPQVVSLQDGMAWITGGMGYFYDGHWCGEAFTPCPPVLYIDGTTAGYNDPNGQLQPSTTYYYQTCFVARDDAGVLHRSVPSASNTVILGSSDNAVADILVKTTPITLRWHPRHILAIHLYRGTGAGVMYRANPDTVQPNRGNVGEVTLTDLGQWQGEALYTGGGVLEAECPEGHSCATLAGGRLWLGGFFRRARLQYSKPVAPGTPTELALCPEFHSAMGIVAPDDREVVAVAEMDASRVVLCRDAVYVVAGEGPADDGSGNDMTRLQLVTDAVGCDYRDSVASYPGGVLFAGGGIIHAVGRDLAVQPVGQVVRDVMSTYPVVRAATVCPDDYEVRFVVAASTAASADTAILVYDYRTHAWSVWYPLTAADTSMHIQSACWHDGTYYVATDSAVYYLGSGYVDVSTGYSMVVETPWIQPAGPDGWQRVRAAQVAYERIGSAVSVQLDVYTNFDDATPTRTVSWSVSDMAAMDAEGELQVAFARQKCRAWKLRVTATSNGSLLRIVGISAELGVKSGLARIGEDRRK